MNEKNNMMRKIKSGKEHNSNEIKSQGGTVRKRAEDNFGKTVVKNTEKK